MDNENTTYCAFIRPWWRDRFKVGGHARYSPMKQRYFIANCAQRISSASQGASA
jgi:hypothetical protein